MEQPRTCISCHMALTNNVGNVSFPCPNCAKHEIIRCKHCREIVAGYTCPACGFEGPN